MSKDQKDKSGKQPTIKFHDIWEIDDQQVTSSYRKLWDRINAGNLTPASPAINWWKMATIAASVALLVISGLYWYEHSHSSLLPVEMVYATDRPSQITLSDGTNVWLSAHSQLRYQETFTGKNRDVELDGEAYFEVTHDKKHPFRVQAGGQMVEVLGTSFNVRAYHDEPDVRIALVTGSVRAKSGQLEETIVLVPAQEVTIDKISGSMAVSDVNLDMLMSWKTGKYRFNNQTFEDIAQTLEKGFNVNIRIENEALKTKPYTMRFENNESLEEILDLIQVNAKYTYKYENGIIVIW